MPTRLRALDEEGCGGADVDETRPDSGHGRAGMHHAGDDRAPRRGRRDRRRGPQQRQLCRGRSGARRRADGLHPFVQRHVAARRRASPAWSAPRSKAIRPGAGSSSTASTSLPPRCRIALKCKPHDRFMLVTDAMPTVGSESKEFVLQGKPIVARDGACFDEDGRLAGSDLDMAWAVRNAIGLLDLAPETAFAMASAAPAAFLRPRPRARPHRPRLPRRPRFARRGVARAANLDRRRAERLVAGPAADARLRKWSRAARR